jgi:pimeloyl-ACP methyl ester carboxylesterase
MRIGRGALVNAHHYRCCEVGGLGHSGNWAYQVPALAKSGYRVVLIDSRGHGRSTRDSQPFELMASDVLAVMDLLHLGKAAVVGWSDGACIALILAIKGLHKGSCDKTQ